MSEVFAGVVSDDRDSAPQPKPRSIFPVVLLRWLRETPYAGERRQSGRGSSQGKQLIAMSSEAPL